LSNLPLVSIVTPSYNQAQFLEDTILSVLRQDYPRLEYIVVDGGSADGSVEIIKKYESKLAHWVSEKDRGQSHAIIKGFARAKGAIWGWLCADDLLEPSMVSISVRYLLRNPSIGMTFGDQIQIDGKGNIYHVRRFSAFRSYYLRWGFSIPQETVLFRRQVYEAVGGLDESLHMVMDFDLWCKISKVSSIVHIPAYLGRFRSHVTNKSTIFTKQLKRSAFNEGFPAEYATVFRKHFGRDPSLARRKWIGIITQLQAFMERRSRKFPSEVASIERIRQS
jgi:glycosyltransferase involved in cell wall biosynthesis